MKKGVVLLFVFGIFLISFVSATSITNDLHLNIQVTNSTGSVQTGTFAFVFNISNSSDCSIANIVYSNSTSLTTDDRGVISYYLPDVNLDYDVQYWLCYYRDGSLIDTTKLARTPYTFNAANSSLLDGYDSTFFMPLNTSVFGNFDFNGGWENGGLSIQNGNIYAQTGYFYNITSLNVTKQNLTVNDNAYFVGKVGIGTATPQNTLNVLGAGNFTNSLYVNDKNVETGYDYALNASGGGSANWNANYSTFLTHITWANAVNGTLATLSQVLGFNYYNSTTFDYTTFLTNSTYASLSKLDVTGNINATNSIFSQEKNLSLGYDYALNSSGISWATAYNGTLAKIDASNTFGAFDQTFDTNTLFIDSSNNRVGIGTTSPLSTLSVGGGGVLGAGIYTLGTTYGLYSSGSSRGVWGVSSSIGVYGSGDTGVLGNGNTWDFFAVNSGGKSYFAGKVGIGTAAPQQALSVVGDANITSTFTLGSLKGTYGSGSAYVCVYDNGTLFSSDSACP